MAEFGGPQVSPQQGTQAIVDKLNVTGADLGLSRMTSGSADEIRQRNRAIADAQKEQQEVRMRAARDDKAAQEQINSPEFKATEERLKKAAEETFQSTKELIDKRREEIKVINAKNAAEKKATEALLGNNIEEFLDQMAGRGAAAAAAIGSPTLANQFGVSDFGTANKQLEEMQKAGVSSFMGQDINTVRQNAVGFGLMNAGMGFNQAAGLAQSATGTTPEAEAAKAAARDLASTLPQSTGNLQQASFNMLEAVRELERSASSKVDEAVKNVEANKPAGGGGGGVASSSPPEKSIATAVSTAVDPLKQSTSALDSSIQTLANSLDTNLNLNALDLSEGIGQNLAGFGDSFKAQVDRLEAMSINITFGAPVDVNVNLNGAEALKSITAQAKSEIMQEVTNKLKNLYVGNERIVLAKLL